MKRLFENKGNDTKQGGNTLKIIPQSIDVKAARKAWSKISLLTQQLSYRFKTDLAAEGKMFEDVAFLGFELGPTTLFPQDPITDDGRRLLQEVDLTIDPDAPHFIPINVAWQEKITKATGQSAAKHPTRTMIEKSGQPTSCIMLGANVLIFGRDQNGALVEYVHQRDNLPENPHRLCYSPPGGNVSEKPSQTAGKELREELIFLVEREKRYEVPVLTLPPRYEALSALDWHTLFRTVSHALGQAKTFAALRYGTAFDASKPLLLTPAPLASCPESLALEGRVNIYDPAHHLIDQCRGLIVQTPQGNKIGMAVAAHLPDSLTEKTTRLFPVDGERIPALAISGGRPVVALTISEMDQACTRARTEPQRALDLLKALHRRLKAAGALPPS
jgi:hypothetical protein